jgi:hypothetical protein
MRRGVIIGLLLAALAPAGQAQGATPRPIVYAVVIDGLDGDKVDAGKAPFISSLLGSCQTTGPADESKPPTPTSGESPHLPHRRDGVRGDSASGQPR